MLRVFSTPSQLLKRCCSADGSKSKRMVTDVIWILNVMMHFNESHEAGRAEDWIGQEQVHEKWVNRGKVTAIQWKAATLDTRSWLHPRGITNVPATISRAHSIGCGEIVKVTVMVMPHPRATLPLQPTDRAEGKHTWNLTCTGQWAVGRSVESSGYFIAYQLCAAYYNVTIGTNH